MKKGNYFVTGACGTVGLELVFQLLKIGGDDISVIAVDKNEQQIFECQQRFLGDTRVQFVCCDIVHKESVRELLQNINFVFHTAAMKHVVVCERSPREAIRNNVSGIQNLIECVAEAGVEAMVFTSSDKAVNPTSVMGTTKLMGERLMTAANAFDGSKSTRYVSTRFGNVLGSSGSVVEIFRNQLTENLPLTITHRDMNRFVMTLPQAVSLVIESCSLAKGGEVFVTKMPVLNIEDLAHGMRKRYLSQDALNNGDCPLVEIGVKPGEKMYEELISSEEARRTVESGDFYIILPAYQNLYGQNIEYAYQTCPRFVGNHYVSDDQLFLNEHQIENLLIELERISQDRKVQAITRYFPGDR